MRKIKYKAWIYNTDLEKYILQDVLQIVFSVHNNDICEVYTKSFRQSDPFNLTMDSYDSNKVELLEFTGQYDIDGKEIYSGYIVRFAVPNPTGYESYDGEWVDTTEEEPCGEVVFKDGCYCVKYPNGELLPFNTPTSEANKAPIIKMFEVLGNVYENKELLEKEN